MRLDMIRNGRGRDAAGSEADAAKWLGAQLVPAAADPTSPCVPRMNFAAMRHRDAIPGVLVTCYTHDQPHPTGRSPMTSDREFEELFDSLQYMLREAHKNQWPRSPQVRDEMRDYLVAALEPTYQALAL